MLLKDVLIVLENQNRGISRRDLYLMLFEPDTTYIDDQKFKNIFGKRPLTKDIFEWICSDEGFLRLCERIHSRYLHMTGNNRSIYNNLCRLAQEDPHLPQSRKTELLSSADPENEESLSRFIALCILCGNNNTNQEKDGFMKGNDADYGLNLHTYISCLPTPVEYRLWKASQNDLLRSRIQGSRFASFNIIQHLLPRGYIASPHFDAKGIADDNKPRKVMELCQEADEHMAIVGNGGIGKTTFLHQIMLDEYLEESPTDGTYRPTEYKSGRPVPFFIELNRCPEKIREWRDDTLQKSNFITRYIGQLCEGHLSMDGVDKETLSQIEKEFQRTPADGRPRYLLLLDGFNEVRSSKDHSIRAELSNEITVLSEYPNIRIITASRETQAAYFAARFKNVRLIGLEKDDILSYLHACGMSETKTGLIKANSALMECLSVPLNLCMFCAGKGSEILPETQGEIFYNFFHKDSAFYNIRRRAEDTRTNPLSGRQTAFILDFVLPFIGWSFEHNDCFSASTRDIDSMIFHSISLMEKFCQALDAVPYRDFECDTSILLETAETLQMNNSGKNRQIIDCIHGYLGILYLSRPDTGDHTEWNRYSFCHHQFRDYFSAIWEIQLLSLLSCIPVYLPSGAYSLNGYNNSSIDEYINSSFWSNSKIGLISQILMEHHNKPYMDGSSGRWYLPKPVSIEQTVLKSTLDFCRNLVKANANPCFLLQNVLSTITAGRGELSGEDLRGLDLKSCNFFNVACSRTGKTNTLAADFRGSHLHKKCFEPVGHRNQVIDFLYSGRFCYTIDSAGCVKCWDVHSGKMEYNLQEADSNGLYDYTESRFLKLSSDKKWLAVKIQNSIKYAIQTGVNLIKLDTQGYISTQHKITLKLREHSSLDALFFTDDSKGILLLCDKSVIYCYDLDKMTFRYRRRYPVLIQGTILHSPDMYSPIHAITGDYDPLERRGWYTKNYLKSAEKTDVCSEDDMMENIKTPIPCCIYELSYDSGICRKLYCFTGTKGASPTAEYIPYINGFLLFNYSRMQIELFDCGDKSITPVFPEITEANNMSPSHFHPHAVHPTECYIMYPHACYLVDLDHPDKSGIILEYFIDKAAKLLPEGNAADKLCFKTSVSPVDGRFIVTDDSFIYEWDSEHDSLLPRYNAAYYKTTNLIYDRKHNEFILVHQNNGLSVFSEYTVRLKNSIAFQEEGYNVTKSCFDSKNRNLVLTFTRPDHEKILLLNLDSSEQRYCFSTHLSSEAVVACCFDNTGRYLLIMTQYDCYEYMLSKDLLLHVQSAENGARYASGNYCGNVIEIVVVPDKRKDANTILERCEHYARKICNENIYYSMQDYYVLPELSDDLYTGFISRCFDYDNRETVVENGIQSFCVSRGFFYPPEKGVLEFDLPELTFYTGAKKKKCQKRKAEPLQMLYFRRTHVLDYRYKQYNTSCKINYTYLDESTGQTVFLKNMQNIFYCPDYRNTSYREIWNTDEKKISCNDCMASWSFIIPLSRNRLICCYKGFSLAVLNSKTGEKLKQIDYTPGMAVFGCDFRNAVLKWELNEELYRNGGRV